MTQRGLKLTSENAFGPKFLILHKFPVTMIMKMNIRSMYKGLRVIAQIITDKLF